MMTSDNSLRLEMEKIYNRLKKVKKRFGLKLEYVMFLTQYNDKQEFLSGIHESDIQTLVNHDVYADLVFRSKHNRIEHSRFSDFMRLGKFRVKCINDLTTPELNSILDKYNSKWIKNGEVYIVNKIFNSIIDDSLCFGLLDRNGNELKLPEPYDGFSSIRFIPDNYSNLN